MSSLTVILQGYYVQLQKTYFKEHILMAPSVAEINLSSLSSEIHYSKSLSHIENLHQ